MAEKKEHSEHEGKSHEPKKKIDYSKLNYWMVATVVLALVLIVIVCANSFSTISEKTAAKKIVDLATLSGLNLTVLDVKDAGNLYQVNYSIQGQTGVIGISKDGKYVGQMNEYPKKTPAAGSNQQDTAPAEVPKSARPKVELYVWGYCPYGVQMQGPMADVAQLLKANADFEVVPYYDGHGAFETQENKIELCVQKLFKDKYWAYASKFVSDVYPKCSANRTVDCDKTESAKVMKSLGIDSTSVMSCVSTQGDALFAAAKTKAQQNSVSGSPTVIINGVVIGGNSCSSDSNCNVGESCVNDGSGGKVCMLDRSADSVKLSVCDTFTTAPAACSQKVNSSAVTGNAVASGSCGA